MHVSSASLNTSIYLKNLQIIFWTMREFIFGNNYQLSAHYWTNDVQTSYNVYIKKTHKNHYSYSSSNCFAKNK